MFLNNIFFKNYIFLLFLILFTLEVNAIELQRGYKIQSSDLKIGDIIFWVKAKDHNQSSHVAIIYEENSDPSKVKIIHATNSKKFYKIAVTRLKSMTELEKDGNIFRAFRIKNDDFKNYIFEELTKNLNSGYEYSKSLQDNMNLYNESIRHLPIYTRYRIQNLIFEEYSYRYLNLKENEFYSKGVICSQYFIFSLQQAFKKWKNIENHLSFIDSLKLDPFLANNDIILFALVNGNYYFEDLGILYHKY